MQRNKYRENQSVDYNVYLLTWREGVWCIVFGVIVSGFAAWLLYKSVWGVMTGVVIIPFYRWSYRETKIMERKRELLLQFKETMQSVSSALVSGYSIENAWIEAEKEMRELYGKNAFIVRELKQMNGAVKMNRAVEKELYRFALRSGCEDIKSFAEVFLFAKRSGGDFGKIIQNTTKRIGEKIEVEREIETVIAGKKMEQKVMNAVPVGLLCYLNITAEEFLRPLYGNYAGVCIMTVAFCIYMMAFVWARKMVTIRI